jgi:capsular polysaccharide biosynthesis protein
MKGFKHRLLSSRLARRYLLPYLAQGAYRRTLGPRDEIAPAPVGDPAALGERVELLPAALEHREPSFGLAEDALMLLRRGRTLIANHRAAIEGRSVETAETYFSNLISYTRYPVPPAVRYGLRDVRVLAPEGGMLTVDGRLIEASVHAGRFRSVPRPPADLPRLAGSFVSLLAWDADVNYAHWLMDALPRLALLPERFEERILVPAPLLRFHAESLELLGLGAQLEPVEPGWVELERVVLLCAAERSIVTRGELLRELRRRFATAVAASDAAPTRRVYLSRVGQRRALLNEAELLPVLDRHGFEVLHPEQLDFAQQVELFASTAVLAGYHGAGSYNELFMPSGGTVIEVLNPSVFDHGAARVAAQLGHRHWYCLAEDAGHGHDACLAPEKLDRLLAYALGEGDAVEAHY